MTFSGANVSRSEDHDLVNVPATEVIDLERVWAFIDRLDDLRGIGFVDEAVIAEVNRHWETLSGPEQAAAFRVFGQWSAEDLIYLREVLMS